MKARDELFTELRLEERYKRLIMAIANHFTAAGDRPRDLNDRNIARAFHHLAVAADEIGALDLAHSASQLARVWGLDSVEFYIRCATTVH